MAIAQRTRATPASTPPKKLAPKTAASPAPKPNGSASTGTHAKEAVITVTTTMLENGQVRGEPVEQEQREVKIFAGPVANVGYGLSFTRNMGNYEGVKVQCSVHVPCYVEEIDYVSAQAYDKCKALLEAAIEDFQIEGSGAAVAGEEVATDEAAAEVDGTAAEGEAEDGGVTVEYIKEADRETLDALCTTNAELQIDPADYAEDNDLRLVLVQAIHGEEAMAALQAEFDGTATDGGEAAEEEQGLFTEEELNAATLPELKQQWDQWELGPHPKGPPAVVKKAMIKKMLAAQAGE